MDPITVRPFQPGDEGALAAILRRAIDGLVGEEYSAAQRAIWRANAPDAATILALYTDGRAAFVAEHAGAPAGFSDVAPTGHIRFLYVAPEAARRGVARRLLEAAERAATQRAIPRLFSEASETALPAFRAAGFTALHRRDFAIDGIAIHNHAVEKLLS